MSRSKVLISLIIFFSVLSVVSCSKKHDSPSNQNSSPQSTNNNNSGNNNGGSNTSNSSLDLSASSVSFNSSSGDKNVSVSSNVNWTVSDDKSWISVSPSSGTNNGSFYISVDENTSSDSRSGSVDVSGGGVSKYVSVNQDAGQASGGTGTITFYKPENYYDAIHLYFNGNEIGVLGPDSRYPADPGCNASGCISVNNLSYGTYSYHGDVLNSTGSSVVFSASADIVLNSACKTVRVNPH